MSQYWERAGYVLVNLLLLVAGLFFFSSCTTFQKAFNKYATNKVDTNLVTIRQVIPVDSTVLQIVTDTTTVTREVRQGRARIIYQRNPNTTIVRAECDSVVIEKKVPQYITKQVWGVDPAWKDKAGFWKSLFIGLAIGVFVVGFLLYLFTKVFKLNIQKRDAGAQT